MDLKTGNDGLLPVIVQHAITGEVLMLAYTTPTLLQKTLEEGRMWFWSRSRGEPWLKGSTSGNYLGVESVTADCDGDALLVSALPGGPSCHTGEKSCFHRPIRGIPSSGIINDLFGVIKSRRDLKPEGSYTARLLAKGEDAILRKVSEEGCEVILASKEGERQEIIWEVADLWYHTLVLLAYHVLDVEDVLEELARRAGKGNTASQSGAPRPS